MIFNGSKRRNGAPGEIEKLVGKQERTNEILLEQSGYLRGILDKK